MSPLGDQDADLASGEVSEPAPGHGTEPPLAEAGTYNTWREKAQPGRYSISLPHTGIKGVPHTFTDPPAAQFPSYVSKEFWVFWDIEKNKREIDFASLLKATISAQKEALDDQTRLLTMNFDSTVKQQLDSELSKIEVQMEIINPFLDQKPEMMVDAVEHVHEAMLTAINGQKQSLCDKWTIIDNLSRYPIEYMGRSERLDRFRGAIFGQQIALVAQLQVMGFQQRIYKTGDEQMLVDIDTLLATM